MFEPEEKVTINPQYGPIGEEFRFSANGFEPSTPLKASIIGPSPSEQIIYESGFTTNEEGRIVFSKKTDLWSSGIYTFKVTGKSSNGAKTVKENFRLVYRE
jgi:hypothetical protein